MAKLQEDLYPIEPMPEWFFDAVCSIETPELRETVRAVSRNARRYAHLTERAMEVYANAQRSNVAVSLNTSRARAMAILLWTALAALEAADIVVTEKPGAQA